MHHFLSVCLSVCLAGLDQNSDWIIIHISESIAVRPLKLAVTGRAHCQRQVAFLLFQIKVHETGSHQCQVASFCFEDGYVFPCRADEKQR